MPIEKIMQLQSACSREQNMALILAINCAPILKGSKAANIVTVNRREFERVGGLLEGTGISFCFLKSGREKALLYLYREEPLKACLEAPGVWDFLAGFGYRKQEIRRLLWRLAGRIRLYGDAKAAFPHEIGIFLGYPLMDVKGFIENAGKNYIYSGYWKVYHDMHSAMRLFRRYDEEREMAVGEIVLGKTIREIAVS